MASQEEILSKYADEIKGNFISEYIRTGRKASGRFEREIRTNIRDNGFDIIAPSYANFFIGGRGKTSPMGPYMKTDKPLYERIRQWMKDKGIAGNEYAIANKIHLEGYKGSPEIFSNSVPKDLLERISDEFFGNISAKITTELKNIIANGSRS